MIASLLLGIAQDPLVDLPAIVDDAPTVVAALAKASGKKLSVEGPIRNEVLGLASPRRPLAEALDALAVATDAEWVEKQDGLTLRRTPSSEMARRMRDRKSQVENNRSDIEWYAEDIQPLPLNDEQARKLVSALWPEGRRHSGTGEEPKRPIAQLSIRLMQAVGATNFADLKPGMTVFSTMPTPRQKPFPTGVGNAVERFVADQAVFAKNFKALISSLQSDMPVASNGISKVMLEVRITDDALRRSGSLLTSVYDDEGRLVDSNHTYLFGPKSPNPPQWADMPKITHPEELAAFRNVRNARPEMRAKFRKPGDYEPLAWVARGPLAALSSYRQATVAASIPDQFLAPAVQGLSPIRETLGEWLADLDPYGLERIEKGGAIVLRPWEPLYCDRTRFDRQALQRLIASEDAKGFVRLKPALDYASAQPSFSQTLAYNYLGRMDAIGARRSLAAEDGLHFFNLLTESQRTALRNGQVFRKDQFNRDQQKVLDAMIQTMGSPSAEPNLAQEPTESAAKSWSLSAEFSEGVGWFRGDHKRQVGLREIADWRIRRQRPGNKGSLENPAVYAGRFRDWSFTLSNGNEPERRWGLSDIVLEDQPYAFAKMPEAAEKEINDLMLQIRQRYSGSEAAPTVKKPPPY